MIDSSITTLESYTNYVGELGYVWYGCITDRTRPAGWYKVTILKVYSYHSTSFGFYQQCCDVILEDGHISHGHFKVRSEIPKGITCQCLSS